MPHGPQFKQQIRDRVEYAAFLISEGRYDGEIKRALCNAYKISARQAQTYMARGRALLDERGKRTRQQLRDETLAWHEAVVSGVVVGAGPDGRDRPPTVREKQYSRKRIAELRGLEEPKQVNVFTPDGISIEVSDPTQLQMRKLLDDPEAMELARQFGRRMIETGATGDDHDENGNGHSNGNGKAKH